MGLADDFARRQRQFEARAKALAEAEKVEQLFNSARTGAMGKRWAEFVDDVAKMPEVQRNAIFDKMVAACGITHDAKLTGTEAAELVTIALSTFIGFAIGQLDELRAENAALARRVQALEPENK